MLSFDDTVHPLMMNGESAGADRGDVQGLSESGAVRWCYDARCT